MSWSRDVSKVFQGVGLVAEHFVRQNSAVLRNNGSKWYRHGEELAQSGPVLLQALQDAITQVPQNSNMGSPVEQNQHFQDYSGGAVEEQLSQLTVTDSSMKDHDVVIPSAHSRAQIRHHNQQDILVCDSVGVKQNVEPMQPLPTSSIRSQPSNGMGVGLGISAPAVGPASSLGLTQGGFGVSTKESPSLSPSGASDVHSASDADGLEHKASETGGLRSKNVSPVTYTKPSSSGSIETQNIESPNVAAPRSVSQGLDGGEMKTTSKQRSQEITNNTKVPVRTQWNERHVPSTPLQRVFGFGALAARLVVGTVSESLKNIGKENSSYKAALVSETNAETLAKTLCEMRGAALKLGQLLSIQDESIVPPVLVKALERVRQGADVMPKRQLYEMLVRELGDDWREKFSEFDEVPIAAASIGQVHRAVLKDGREVALKVQYPGVAESIDSDLVNLKRLITYTNLLPKGLYVDEIIKVGKEELRSECDYKREAANQRKFKSLLASMDFPIQVHVPEVIEELTTSRVLTTELVAGIAVDKCENLTQEMRNDVARSLLKITVNELFNWRFMQTDPNWGNFLFDPETNTLSLIDFGAARDYSQSFVDEYIKIVWSAAERDTKTLLNTSLKLGFLTGDESPVMMKAHEQAGLVVGEPFQFHEPFDFYGSRMVVRLSQYAEIFMKERLTPPPREAYSLHRKLSGAYLICIKLKAVIPCRDLMEEAWERIHPTK